MSKAKERSALTTHKSGARRTPIRRWMEETQRQEGKYFRALIENSMDAIAIVNSDGTISYESPSIERVLGFKPEELIGKNMLEFIHPDDVQSFFKTHAMVIENPGQLISMELRLLHKDGSWRVLEGTGNNLLDDPRINGVVINFRDITERKRAEQELQESREQYSLLVENLADAVFRFKEGVITWGNDRMREMLGYDECEMIGVDVNLFVSDETALSSVYREVDAGLKGKGHFHGVMRARKKDGSVIDIEYSASQVPGREPIEIVGVAHDITERKRTEEELRESERRFRQIFNGVNDEIVYTDTDGVILNMNGKSWSMFGYAPDEMIGRNVLELDLFDPDELSKLSELMMASVEQGGAQRPLLEVQIRHRNGYMVPAEVSTSLIAAADGTPEGYISIIRDITERKRMEGELLVKENAVENSINAMAISDIKGNITYVNQACLALWRRDSKEEILGKSYWELLELEDSVVAQDIANAMIANGWWEGELAARRKDGSEIHVQVLTAIIKDEKGNPVQSMSSFVDVTERTRAEEALRRSEELFKELTENVADTIVIINGDGSIRYQSPSFQRMVGEKRSGSNPFEFVHPDDIPKAFELFNHLLQTPGCTVHTEIRGKHRDGSWRSFEVVGKNLLDNPAVLGIVGNFRDITERKRASEALRVSEERFRVMFDNAVEGILLAHAGNKKFRMSNKKLQQMLGYTEEEIKRLGVMDIHPKEELHYVLEHFEKQEKGEIVIAKDIPVERKDGSVFYADVSSGPITLDGEVYIMGMFSDITERRKAEEERERLNAEIVEKNRELEHIVYVSSHDLRSPLVNIQGFSKELNYSLQELVSILQNNEISQEVRGKLAPIIETDIADSLIYIQSSILKMDSLLSGLLRLSRLGRAALNFELLDINEMVSEILKANEYRIKAAKVTVEFGDLPPCTGDSVQINQVISNLVDNALKYLDLSRPGTIKIAGRTEGGRTVYCVEDNGIGIAEEDQARIFEIFQQLNPGSSSGEGLGLSVVKKILSRQDGRIWVESELGAGSRFFVSLPASN